MAAADHEASAEEQRKGALQVLFQAMLERLMRRRVRVDSLCSKESNLRSFAWALNT